ncbi:MAG TPA: MFS transporter [Candidatus Binatia bacterium]|nr:MFS transporter [Candidatus Binatia bacterium]
MTAPKSQQPDSRYRWEVLFASVLAFTMYAYALQSVPPLLQQFQAIFNVNAATAGLLMSMVVIPGIILALPAGIIISKYSFRKIGFLSTITIGIGSLITAFSLSFPMALLGRFIIGLGGGLLGVGTPAIIPQWFEHQEMGRAMSVFAVGMPAGTVAAFFSAPILSQSFGWQSLFYVGALVSILSAIFFWGIVRDGPLKGDSTVKVYDVRQALTNREVWKASLVWMFFNMAAIGFLTWAPDLFVTFKGLTPLNASLFSSLIMVSIFFFIPIIGYVSDRSGMRKPLIIASLALMALILYVITYLNGTSLGASVIFLGASASSVPPIIMATIAQTLPPKLANMSFSTVALWQNIGIALIAPIVGYFLVITNSFLAIFLVLSIFAIIGAAVAFTLRSR